jgi:hypothetical protein
MQLVKGVSMQIELSQRTEASLTDMQRLQVMVTAAAYLRLQQEIKRLERQAETKLAELEALRDATGQSTVDVDGYRLTRIHGTRSVLSEEKLIAQGVTTAMLQNATETKPNRPYTKVTGPTAQENK